MYHPGSCSLLLPKSWTIFLRRALVVLLLNSTNGLKKVTAWSESNKSNPLFILYIFLQRVSGCIPFFCVFETLCSKGLRLRFLEPNLARKELMGKGVANGNKEGSMITPSIIWLYLFERQWWPPYFPWGMVDSTQKSPVFYNGSRSP